MTEVVSMANGHRTLPAPTTSQDRHILQQHTPSATPSSSAEQTKRTLPMDSEPPVSSQPIREWGIDPHLGKDAELRKQLLSAIGGDEAAQQPTPVSSQQQPSSSPRITQRADTRPSSSLSPGSGGEESHLKGDPRAKRELNTSKRAAQNRNAQRAFRARKEEYIKSLEAKVRDYEAVEERNQALETENTALRQYIMHLQRRLLDHLGEGEALPDPPAGLNIEGLHISSRPASSRASLKPELPPISSIHEKAPLPESIVGVKRARVD